ncbi:ATP-binding protein [Vibrio sp. kj40-1]|uniref:histidine kinase n=1 Tax=Vibrio algarum TaxID=3020714 RepID=A0ABT4YX71_9VIBR|nr:ATP-binding protein [Vibrio sp. KJ40-1]MDB1126188.1 ATP-binding protein [Vibrio sp. KJ40-1]
MHVDKEARGYWFGDATRITQVLNNLISNAIKFTSYGGVSVNVSMDERNEGYVLFRVIDTGVGISEQDKDKLFDAFTQVGSAKAKLGGTGLGLAISNKIVTALHGYLEVGSQLNQGSVFSFSIPLEPAKEITTEQSSARSENNLIANIIMVEDNPVNRLVAEGFLTNHGHKVVIAENGEQAKSIFKQQKFDIALLDINLPDCNGVELLADLKAIEMTGLIDESQRIPMVAISAHVFNEEVQGYLNAGFDAYLSKPIDKNKLLNLVQSTLEGRIMQLPQQLCNPVDSKTLVDSRVLEADREVLGNEKVSELISLFENSSSTIINQIDEAVTELKPDLVKQLAHKLKGSAGSMGMNALHIQCLEVEADQSPIDKYLEQRDLIVLTLEKSISMVKS